PGQRDRDDVGEQEICLLVDKKARAQAYRIAIERTAIAYGAIRFIRVADRSASEQLNRYTRIRYNPLRVGRHGPVAVRVPANSVRGVAPEVYSSSGRDLAIVRED